MKNKTYKEYFSIYLDINHTKERCWISINKKESLLSWLLESIWLERHLPPYWISTLFTKEKNIKRKIHPKSIQCPFAYHKLVSVRSRKMIFQNSLQSSIYFLAVYVSFLFPIILAKSNLRSVIASKKLMALLRCIDGLLR